MDSGVAGTGADEPAKLKEEDLNRHRFFISYKTIVCDVVYIFY